MIYIAIDNGVSGSISAFKDGKFMFFPTPTFKQLHYTKEKQFVTRIDVEKLVDLFQSLDIHYSSPSIPMESIKCVIERPMVNPMRFKASASALRAMEATLIVLERLQIPYQWIDSKEWQRAMLPSGLHGDELKKASLDVARRLAPYLGLKSEGDSLCMVEYLRRKDNNEVPNTGR